MAAIKIVFGIRILLDDSASPVVPDSDIGLYNGGESDNTTNIAPGGVSVTVVDGSVFIAGELATISDDSPGSELIKIKEIAGNVITLNDGVIGTYLVAENAKITANSYFAWTQNDVPSVTGWKSGIIAQNGMKKFVNYIMLKRGGNTATPGGAGVDIINTNQFDNIIETKGIRLQGKIFQVYAFRNTTPYLEWSGNCKKPTRTTKIYSISARGYHTKRIVNQSAKITTTRYPDASSEILNTAIPMTFGKITPLFDSDGNVGYNGYAKMQRTSNKEETFKNYSVQVLDVANNITANVSSKDTGRSIFPITPSTYLPGTDLTYAFFRVQSTAVSGQKIVNVSNGSIFRVGDVVTLQDNSPLLTETNTIGSILVNQLTFVNNLTFDLTAFDSFVVFREIAGQASVVFPVRLTLNDVDIVWKKGASNLSEDANLDVLEGQFIKVIDGSSSGDFRKIETAIVILDGQLNGQESSIVIRVSNYFSEVLAGNFDAMAENQSWCTIKIIDRKYSIDIWPCKSFLNDDGTEADLLNLYSHSTDSSVNTASSNVVLPVNEKALTFYKIPEYAYRVESALINNIIDIDIDQFSDNPDKVISFITKPMTEYLAMEDDDLSSFALSESDTLDGLPYTSFVRSGGPLDISGPSAAADNIYVQSGTLISRVTNSVITGDLTEVSDKNRATKYTHSYEIGRINSPTRTMSATRFVLPSPPNGFLFDSVFLGIMFSSSITATLFANANFTEFLIRYRRFMGFAKKVVSGVGYLDFNDDAATLNTEPGRVRDDADFVYSATNNESKNKFFNINNIATPTIYNSIVSGYKDFQFQDIDNAEKYSSIEDIVIMLYHNHQTLINPALKVPIEFEMNQLFVMFQKEVSIKNEVYTPFSGRIFNSTWDTRKTSASLMQSPVDLFESTERLSNWSDRSIIPTDGWGKGYASGALIETGASGRGSFDDTTDSRLTTIRNFNASTQFQKYNKMFSDKIKKSLCKDFFLASWYDKDGFAKVATFTKPKDGETVPIITNIITLSDIIDRSKIKIVDPDVGSMYPEPYFNFNLNFATGEYESRIAVTNSDQPVYVEGYVEGMTGFKAETLWNRCHEIWQRCGHLDAPPKDMTDKIWMNGEEAQTMAEDGLQKWADWMGNSSIFLNVHYNKARLYEEATEFIVQLPHQTDNVQLRCLLEKKTTNPNPPYTIDLEAILFNEELTADTILKDVWTNFENDDDWKDTYINYGDDSDKKDNS